MPVIDITNLIKLRKKYSSMLAYIALLNQEIDKHSARLEELRKKKAEEKKAEEKKEQK